MDWFDPSTGAHPDFAKANTISAKPQKPCELTAAILALRRALKVGGRAFWRSAGMDPWYVELFEKNGFKVERLSVREVGSMTPIDNVNM